MKLGHKRYKKRGIVYMAIGIVCFALNNV